LLERRGFAAMSGAQQGYYTDRQQYGTFQAPPFMQQPPIPSPGGMYYPSVPGFTLSVLPLPLLLPSSLSFLFFSSIAT